MNAPILELRNISKSFGGLKALDNISFSVQPGELLGIAGPNGSGKSTLFNVVTRIPFGPSDGKIFFRGQRIDNVASHKIAKLGLTRTFQKDAEFPILSALQTVELAAVYGSDDKTARHESVAQLEALGFALARQHIPTSDLSVYERKQTMIASALVMNPDILMLDEPASGLTRPEIESLDKLLVGINRSGITVVLIEHVLTLLLSVAQRMLVLNEGKLLASGDPKTVIRNPAVIEAYLGKRAA